MSMHATCSFLVAAQSNCNGTDQLCLLAWLNAPVNTTVLPWCSLPLSTQCIMDLAQQVERDPTGSEDALMPPHHHPAVQQHQT